jgi:hypothetical protein
LGGCGIRRQSELGNRRSDEGVCKILHA